MTFESCVFLFEKGSQVAPAGLKLVLSLRRTLDGIHSCFVDAQHAFHKLSSQPCVLWSVCMPPHACGGQKSLSYHVDSAVHTWVDSVARAFTCRALTTASLSWPHLAATPSWLPEHRGYPHALPYPHQFYSFVSKALGLLLPMITCWVSWIQKSAEPVPFWE